MVTPRAHGGRGSNQYRSSGSSTSPVSPSAFADVRAAIESEEAAWAFQDIDLGSGIAKARRSRVPSKMVQFAAHPHISVRWNVAKREHCPPEVLAVLAEDPEQTVRTAALSNPACPPGSLAKAAATVTAFEAPSIMSSPATPTEALRTLLNRSLLTPIDALAHPNCPPEIIRQAHAVDADKTLRVALLRSEHPDPLLVSGMLRSPHFASAAAACPICPIDDIRAAVFDRREYTVAEMATTRDDCPADLLDWVVRKHDPPVKVFDRVVRHPNTSVETLSYIARDDWQPTVRRGLAMNPNTPPAVLRRYATGKDSPLAKTARRNPSCPDDI